MEIFFPYCIEKLMSETFQNFFVNQFELNPLVEVFFGILHHVLIY